MANPLAIITAVTETFNYVDLPAAVSLDGTTSTVGDGASITAYAWSFVDIPPGSTAAFNDDTSPTPSFTADLAGNYIVRLVVQNNLGDYSEADFLTALNDFPDSFMTISVALENGYVKAAQFQRDWFKDPKGGYWKLVDGVDDHEGRVTALEAAVPIGVTPHASDHEDGGSDEILIENLPTADTNSDHVLRPDGVGGVGWGYFSPLKVDTIEEVTPGLGVTIDGVLIKDGVVTDVVRYDDTTTAAMTFVIDEDSFASNLDTKVPTQQSVKAYVDAAAVGLLDYKGGYNADTNTPDLDVSPSGVKKGDAYAVTVAGTFFTEALEIGDFLFAEIDNPTVLSDWTIVNKNTEMASATPLEPINTVGSVGTSAKAAREDHRHPANLVADTTPQLGGALDVNGQEIQSVGATDITVHSDRHVRVILGDSAGVDKLSVWDNIGGQVAAIDSDGNVTVSGTVDGRDVAADGSKLDGIEAGADVTDATNVDAAGAVMNSDSTTAAMTFVIDEDSFASNLDTKVPTQQSVKAYVDAQIIAGGLQDIVEDLTPQLGGALDVNGKEIVSVGATDVDIHSDGNVIVELGDSAGVKVLSVRDSGAVEVASLNSDGVLKTNTINEYTAAAGVTIDGTLIKDGVISTGTVTSVQGTTFNGNNVNVPGTLKAPTVTTDGAPLAIECTGDMTIKAISGDIWMTLGDAAGVKELRVTDSAFGTRATIDSDGNVDFYGTQKTDTIDEHTASAGVTIEGVLLKDNSIQGNGGDVTVVLGDAAGAKKVKVWDNVGGLQTTIDSDGNVDTTGLVSSDNTTSSTTQASFSNFSTWTTIATLKTLADGFLVAGDVIDLRVWVKLTNVDASDNLGLRVVMGSTALLSMASSAVTDSNDGDIITLWLEGVMGASADTIYWRGAIRNLDKGLMLLNETGNIAVSVTGAQDLTIQADFDTASVNNSINFEAGYLKIHRP